MYFYKLLSLSLAILRSALAVSCSFEKCPCTKPAIRREWRALTTEEKADWIRAVNVRIDARLCLAEDIFGFQCLSQLPHDPALTPSVDPSVSLIPPVNASSSYYDGTPSRLTSLFRMLGVLTAFCTDITYLHMDLNTRVLKSESYRYHLRLNVHFFRYIGPDNSFLGTAGSYTSSKSH